MAGERELAGSRWYRFDDSAVSRLAGEDLFAAIGREGAAAGQFLSFQILLALPNGASTHSAATTVSAAGGRGGVDKATAYLCMYRRDDAPPRAGGDSAGNETG